MIPECIQKAFENGGALTLLVDFYLTSETLHLTCWTESIRYQDAITGSVYHYTPAPFAISDEGVTHDPKEVAILSVQLGIFPGLNSEDVDFTETQRAHFSELLSDIDDYLQRRDPRGSLVIFRIVNPNDLSDDVIFFTGIVDEWELGDEGILFEVAEAKDILSANSYPLSPTCGYSFGDSRCGVNREDAANKYEGAADSGSDETQIIDADIDPNSAGYWDIAIIEFIDGDNAGISREVAAYDNATGTVTFDIPLDFPVSTGDQFRLRRKCKKSFNHCKILNTSYYRFGGNPYLNDMVQGLYWRGKG